jgi:hypothetical protein
MKTPRHMLNIELFEDRLLPSSLALDGLSASVVLPSYTSDITPWDYRTAAPSGAENSFGTIPISHNAGGNALTQVTNSDSFSAIPISTSNANSLVNADGASGANDFDRYRIATNTNNGSEPTEYQTPGIRNNSAFVGPDGTTSSPPVSLNDALNGNTISNPYYAPQPVTIVLVISFDEPGSVSDSVEERLPPWLSHDGQLSLTDLLDEMPDPVSPPDRNDLAVSPEVASDSPADPATTGSPQPSEPAAAATTTAPGLFVVPLSQQLIATASLSSEQASLSEQHSISETTLAAVSLVSNQNSPSVPSSLPLLPAYSVFVNATSLPSIALNRGSLSAKTPVQVRVVEAAAQDLKSPLTPIEVNVPNGSPIAGEIGLNASDLDERVSRVLASISSLGEDITLELEQPDAYAWLVAAGLLSVGAGYTVWVNRKSQPTGRLFFRRRSLGSWEGSI